MSGAGEAGVLFRHCCLFALASPPDAALLAELDRFSVAFLSSTPGLRGYRFAPNLSRKAGRFTLVLYSVFDDEEAFRRYVSSPLHAEIAAFLAPFVEETLVGDLIA